MVDYKIGVDGGGSKTHAILVNSDGALIDESYSGSANIATNVVHAIDSITHAIDELLFRNSLDARIVKIGIGVAGYSAKPHLQQLQTTLNTKYTRVVIQSDCHIACLAAHGNHDGAIVICGTGVVGYYIRRGLTKQIGGFGFPQGDLGGGACLGLEACKLLCKAIDGIIPFSPLLNSLYSQFQQDRGAYQAWLRFATPSSYAALAPLVIQCEKQDANAHFILNSACEEISQIIEWIRKVQPAIAIKLTGGLSAYYLDRLQTRFPLLQISTHPAAHGATAL